MIDRGRIMNNRQYEEGIHSKIFFVGDFRTDTGPGIANRAVKHGVLECDEKCYFSCARIIYVRIAEILIKLPLCSAVCICSFSRLDKWIIRYAKLLRKKIFYIMHGYLKMENEINGIRNKTEEEQCEQFILANADKVFCVSERQRDEMRNREKAFANKFYFNYNPIDFNGILKSIDDNMKKDKNQIITIGGGIPRKHNLEICRAIEQLNKTLGMCFKFVVIGPLSSEGSEIKKYEFVEFHEHLPHDEVMKYLQKSFLYIQNSSFETFGLSVIEALMTKCNILVSKEVGMMGLISEQKETDIIFDVCSIDEIAEKILYIAQHGNNDRMMENLCFETLNCKNAAVSLMQQFLQ